MTYIIALLMGAAILGAAVWAIRLLATPPPPEPDPEDLVEVEVAYRCSVCGMRLTITQAQGEDVKAPRHCREEMVPA